jgi:hypothetical protein
MIRRLVVWGAVLAAFVLLAFWLQGAVQDVCIVPAIGLLRMGGLLLRSIPQSLFWSLLVAAATLIVLGSLAKAGRLHLWRPTKEKQVAIRGPIEKLAQQVHHTRRGLYFKWLVAHRLGELGQSVAASGPARLIRRSVSELGEPRKMAADENGDQGAADIQAYIEAGLDRPPISRSRRRFLIRRPPSPLDLDPSRVVEYFESQMETKV